MLVYGVSRAGPAERAHVAPGDILVALAARPLDTVEDLFTALRQHRPGQTVKLELISSGRRETVEIHLSATAQQEATPGDSRPR